MRYLISTLIVLSSVPAYSYYGASGAQILDLNTSARIAAMGNANAGLADDINALIYNPGGLVQLYGTEFQFSHVAYFIDTGVNSFTVARKQGKVGLGFKWKQFSGRDTYRDVFGLNARNFNIRYSQFTLGCAYPVARRGSLGLSVNIISENFALGSTGVGEDKRGAQAGCDIGWHMRGRRGNSFGLVVRNFGGNITIDKEGAELPLKLVIGGAHRMGRFIFVWEAFTGRQTDFAWQSGLEADLGVFKPRCGFMYLSRADITAGFGVPYRNWRLDYAFLPHQDLGIAHRISLGACF